LSAGNILYFFYKNKSKLGIWMGLYGIYIWGWPPPHFCKHYLVWWVIISVIKTYIISVISTRNTTHDIYIVSNIALIFRAFTSLAHIFNSWSLIRRVQSVNIKNIKSIPSQRGWLRLFMSQTVFVSSIYKWKRQKSVVFVV